MTQIKSYRIGDDGKLYNWNITDEDKAKGSRLVTRYRWGDGSPEAPVVGKKNPYQIRIYGNPDEIDNKFPDQAPPEDAVDPDANEPVPVDLSGIFPTATIEKAKSALLNIGAAVDDAIVKSKKAIADLEQTLTTKEPLQEAGDNIKALLIEAQRQLGGGTLANFTPPTKPAFKMPVRGLNADGKLRAFNIDRSKPSRIVTARVLVEVGRDSDGQAIQEFQTTEVKVYADLALLDQYYPQGTWT